MRIALTKEHIQALKTIISILENFPSGEHELFYDFSALRAAGNPAFAANIGQVLSPVAGLLPSPFSEAPFDVRVLADQDDDDDLDIDICIEEPDTIDVAPHSKQYDSYTKRLIRERSHAEAQIEMIERMRIRKGISKHRLSALAGYSSSYWGSMYSGKITHSPRTIEAFLDAVSAA